MKEFDLDRMVDNIEIVNDFDLIPSDASIYDALKITDSNIVQRTCLFHALINQRAALDNLSYPTELHGQLRFSRIFIVDEELSILVGYNAFTDKLIVVKL